MKVLLKDVYSNFSTAPDESMTEADMQRVSTIWTRYFNAVSYTNLINLTVRSAHIVKACGTEVSSEVHAHRLQVGQGGNNGTR